jgi:hypothetical protein
VEDRIPPERITEEMCRAAIHGNPGSIRFVNSSEPYYAELAAEAIRLDPNTLRFIVDPFRTKELCKMAILRGGYGKHFSPQELSYYRSVTTARLLGDGPRGSITISEVKTLSEDYLASVMSVCGEALRHIPEDRCTVKLCRIAVENNLEAVRYVPRKILSDDAALLDAAVKIDPRLLFPLEYIPERLRTKNLCVVACRHYAAHNGDISEIMPQVPQRIRASVVEELEAKAPVQWRPALLQSLEDHFLVFGRGLEEEAEAQLTP